MCAKPAARWLRTQPLLMSLATAATPLLEQYAAPALLLCPVRRWQPAARLLGLGLLLGLQLTFLLTMVLGNFPLVATAAVVPFLPAQAWDAAGRAWDALAPHARAASHRAPSCALSLCASRRMLGRMLGAAPDSAPRRSLRLARRVLTAARRHGRQDGRGGRGGRGGGGGGDGSDGGDGSEGEEGGEEVDEAEAEAAEVAAVAAAAAAAAAPAAAAAGAAARAAWRGALPLPVALLLWCMGAWVGLSNCGFYCGLLARHDGGGGGVGGGGVGGGVRVGGLFGAAVCALPLQVPRGATWLGELLSLYQSWDLFAPTPNREDGWWAVAGQRHDGTLVDAARGGPLTDARPEPPAGWYGGSRWLQYYLRLWEEARKPKPQQNTALFSAMVQWHCRNNNAAGLGPGPPGLVRASLIFTRERTPPPGEAPPPPERLQVWQEECLLSSVAQHQQGRQRQQQAKIPANGSRAPDAASRRGDEAWDEEGE